DVLDVLVRAEPHPVLCAFGKRVSEADVGSRSAGQLAVPDNRAAEITGPVRTPAARGRQRHTRREVLLLAWPGIRIGRNKGIRGHQARLPAPVVAAAKQTELDGVEEGLPRGFDDVLVDADGRP